MGQEVEPESKVNASADHELVKLVLAGDRERFRELVVGHQHLVYSIILRQVGIPEVAEELAQDTFLRAFRYLASFQGTARFSTWITRIALNLTKDWFASRGAREQRLNDSFAVERHDTTDPSDEHREVEERIARMRRVLPKLKPIYRDVLALCGFEGKSYEEASEILEIPVGTIRSRLHAARLMLRDLMVEDLE